MSSDAEAILRDAAKSLGDTIKKELKGIVSGARGDVKLLFDDVGRRYAAASAAGDRRGQNIARTRFYILARDYGVDVNKRKWRLIDKTLKVVGVTAAALLGVPELTALFATLTDAETPAARRRDFESLLAA